jgi:ribonuclease T1
LSREAILNLLKLSKIVALVFLLIAIGALTIWPQRHTEAREKPTNASSMSRDFPIVLEADLPKEARATLALIAKGGPFPYSKDGVTFSNRERVLAKQPRGYYREYTVKTPGAKNRGARRIVCGTPKSSAFECYYTDDHYATFRKIKP